MNLEERTDVHVRAFALAVTSGIVGSYCIGKPPLDVARENLVIGGGCLLIGYLTRLLEGSNTFTAVAAGAGYVAAMKHMLH